MECSLPLINVPSLSHPFLCMSPFFALPPVHPAGWILKGVSLAGLVCRAFVNDLAIRVRRGPFLGG